MKTNKQIAEAFANRKPAKGLHIYTDGARIWSYGPHYLAAKHGEILLSLNGQGHLPVAVVLINEQKYSQSTSRHTLLIERACAAVGIETVKVAFLDEKT